MSNQKISNIFKDFNLMFIDNKFNEKGFVGFAIYPYADLLLCEEDEWYSFGFYYSNTDNSRYIVTGDTCDLEFERDDGMMFYEYKTEKIIDNWWYYEWISYIELE
ncbi:MAG: hypothetical protein J6K48_05865 [Lachnospiraceae bacterium]|nr:hypothetical protein [Lachnospiraceae bacterium]